MGAIESLKTLAPKDRQIAGLLLRIRLKRGGVSGYLAAFVLMGVALLVRLWIAPLEAGLQYLTFFPAVVLAAVIGGFGPGLFAVFAGMSMATFIFIPPYFTISSGVFQEGLWSNATFLADGIIVCSIVEAMHRYRNELSAAAMALRHAGRIIQTTSDGFLLCDATGKLLEANDSYCRMTGYTHEELLAMRISDLEADESPEDVARHMQQIIDAEHDVFESRHRRKDGSLLDVEISATYSAEHGGAFITFVRDISRRRRIEQEANQARLEIEDLYNNAPCGYHSLDQEGRIIRINQTELDWLEYGRAEVIGRKISDFLTPSSAVAFMENYPRLRRLGSIRNIEADMVRRGGSTFTVLLSATAIYDAGGNFVMNRATIHDITERKRIENELRDSEERFRQLFEKAPVGIAMARQDQKIFMANAAYCRMFGYTQEELRHLTIADLTHPDYRAQTNHLATGVLEGDIPIYSLEKKYLRKDGGTFWGRIIATEIGGNMPQTRYIMGIVEDVTERVEQEAHRLAEVNEQKDMLVREVHHRIKNNLQGVVGLLRQYASRHPAMTEVIDAAIGKVYSIAIVHGLQARSMTDEVDLVGVIRSIIDASACPVAFANELDGPVLLDKDRAVPVALALNELVTNACKHRSADSPAAVKLKADGQHAFVTITNHFDSSHVVATRGGQGLSLARSLLPKESARIFITQIGNTFLAELKLAEPVVIFDNHTNPVNQGRQ